ncbi:hypothetical protein NQ318_022285 [Aromia moschata]|uniref:Uncharacterized protein n=1 Tax=Aromia moschata TaxID=1265417 RepID=A0AAV8Z5K2_9CUCU|nr:hypothetical protein NQ318_022285 [Aromia moschata]
MRSRRPETDRDFPKRPHGMPKLQARVPVLSADAPAMLQRAPLPARPQRRRAGGRADAALRALPIAAGVAQRAALLHPAAVRHPLQPAPAPADARPETELQRLSDTVRALRLSGWYYEGVTYQQSHDMLSATAPGTYLIRNSSDQRFLFSLSVQTDRGPTSVRLFYMNGFFRLDAQPHLQVCKNNAQVWVDPNGKWYSSILLDKPLRKKKEPPSLKHFARLAVHRALRASAMPRLAMLPPAHPARTARLADRVLVGVPVLPLTIARQRLVGTYTYRRQGTPRKYSKRAGDARRLVR